MSLNGTNGSVGVYGTASAGSVALWNGWFRRGLWNRRFLVEPYGTSGAVNMFTTMYPTDASLSWRRNLLGFRGDASLQRFHHPGEVGGW